MTFISSASARAYLNEWDRPLAVNDVLNLLLALKRAAAAAGTPVILIVVVRESVPVPADFLVTCIQGTLPAILDCCERLVVVVEGATAARAALRSAFQPSRRATTRRAAPLIFESLSGAFAHAQRFAPHDVLELQRHILHQTLSSERELDVIEEHHGPRALVGSVLEELASDADAVLLIAKALEDQATGIGSGAHPQKLREMAALVKSAALALCTAAANLVGVTERLSIVSAFIDVEEGDGGDMPS